LGSTGVVVDWETAELVEKATYMPYGAIESDYRPTRWKSFREEYKFTGKEEDIEVGLTYFGARYYHARLGRFISPDPLTVHMAAADPNPYAYVRGRTMSHVDPFGLAACSKDNTDASCDTSDGGKVVSTGPNQLEIIEPPAASTAPRDPAPNPHEGMIEGGLAKASMAAERAEQAANTRLGTDRAYIVPSHVWKETYSLADRTAKLSAGPLGWVGLAIQGGPMEVAAKPGDVSAALPFIASIIAPVGAATSPAAKAPTLVRALAAADLGLAEGTIVEGTLSVNSGKATAYIKYLGNPDGVGRGLLGARAALARAARAEGANVLRIETSRIIEQSGKLGPILQRAGFASRANGTMWWETAIR
jgi:RHS repeat-associated protein